MFTKLRPALLVTRRELRDQMRDWRIVVPIILLTSFFPWLLNFTAKQLANFMKTYGAVVLGDRLIPFLLMIVGFFPITVSLVIALESFVGEKERHSIEPLLSSPLEDWQLYIGKLLAALVIPMVSSYLGTVVYLVGVHYEIGWDPPIALLIEILSLTAVEAIVMVSAAVVISSQTTSVRAANLLASFIVIPMALLIQGESIIMFWGRYDTLWWAILGQMVIAGLLLRMGVAHFNREELLGRELDALNLRWTWSVFWKAFVGQASSPVDWFSREIRLSLQRLKLPLGIMALLLVAAMWIGAQEASIFTLPPETFNQAGMTERFLEGMQTVHFFTVENIPSLWLHNIWAILLASIIGVFSFSVLGVLILMIPLVIVGYFLGAAAGAGFSPWLFAAGFVLPHGVLEIPAILLVGAAILRLGGTLTTPARGKTIGEAWLSALADWARVIIALVLPLLLGAAALEVLVTPRLALMVLGN